MADEYLLYGSWSAGTGTVLLAEGIKESATMDHTLVYQVQNGAWRLQKLVPWKASGIVIRSDTEILLLGEDGEFAVGSGQNYSEGRIAESPTTVGLFNICGQQYAVGMSSIIYKYRGNMVWDIDIAGIEGEDNDFTCMAGNCDVIYVGGWKGVCYRRSSLTWHEEILPTNETLSGMAISEDGILLACSINGGIVIGREGQWDIVKHDFPGDSFLGALSYNGKFLLFGQNTVYEVERKEDWQVTSIYAWPLEVNGVFSDAFIGESNAIWVLAEDGLFYKGAGDWKML